MLAREPEHEILQVTPEAAPPEIAVPEPAPAVEAQMTTEGPIPETSTGAAVEPGQTASEQAFGHKPTAESGQIDGGMYTHHEYKAACEAAGTPDKWSDNYWRGHTEASQWVQPYEGRYDDHFELKPNQSASQAVLDFLAGPTIGDWRVIEVAIEMNRVRGDLGNHRFDQLFGSSNKNDDARIPKAQRLTMSSAMYTIPFAVQMMELAQESNAVDDKAEAPEAPQVAAGLEEKPETSAISHPAPEAVADEMGMQREQELA